MRSYLKKYDFEKDLKQSEDLHKSVFLPLYQELGYTVVSFDDWSNPIDKAYQLAGIDCIALTKDGRVLTIDEKVDNYDRGNVLFELNNEDTNNLGWVYKGINIQDYFVFYYFTVSKNLFIFNVDKVRSWYESDKDNHTVFYLKNKTIKCSAVAIEKIPRSCYRLLDLSDGF